MKRLIAHILWAFVLALSVGTVVSIFADPSKPKHTDFSPLQYNVLEALKDNGVAVLAQGSRFDVHHLIDRGCPPNRYAFFTTLGEHTGLIGLCTVLHPNTSWHTILHEIGHVLQWCESGKAQGFAKHAALGFSDETIGPLRLAIAAEDYPELSKERQRAEAEANTFADRVKITTVPEIIHKVCGE